MSTQAIIVFLLFIAAIAYVARMVYRSIQSKKNGCGTGCNKCGVDFSKVES
ncbi:ABC-type methionine transport system permease subunit [Pedobacter sp. UYEF25]